MSESIKPPFVDADRLLAAFDAAADATVRGQRHKREMELLLLGLIGMIDALRTLEGASDSRSLGVVIKLGLRELTAAGVTPLNAVGQPLDLTLHKVHSMQRSSTVPSDTIIAEVQTGYLWRGQLLRVATVIVSTTESTIGQE